MQGKGIAAVAAAEGVTVGNVPVTPDRRASPGPCRQSEESTICVSPSLAKAWPEAIIINWVRIVSARIEWPIPDGANSSKI